MLDIKLIREKPDFFVKELNKRGGDFSYLHEVVKKDDMIKMFIFDNWLLCGGKVCKENR